MISGIKTDIGSKSKEKGNQDNVIVLKIQIDKGPGRGDYYLIAVADGMGGLEKGELASALTIKGITKTLLNKLITEKNSFLEDEKPLEPDELLKESVEVANLLVFNVSKREYNGEMGSTIVAGLIKSGKLFVAHVGDSRAYLIRRNKIERLTTDHSLVQALYASNLINTAEISHHPQKNIITRSIGFSPRVEVVINEKRNGRPVTLQNKDFIIFCTDGVSNVLNEEEILHLTHSCNYSPQKVADEIIRLANQKETDDNATALCALIEDNDTVSKYKEKGSPVEEPGTIHVRRTKIPTLTLPPPVILCHNCGNKNFLGDINCNSCGKSQIFISRIPTLTIVDGPEKGKNISINKENIYIGREHEGNDLIINEPNGREFISRKHMKIYKVNDDYWLEDLMSRNGTKIRGKQIRGSKVKLKDGDIIIIGMNTLEFKL